MQTEKEEDLLYEIRENFKIAQEYYSEQRELARDDFRFRNGDQFPDSVRASREADGRPCMTINKIPTFVRQVVNAQKEKRPQINVVAVDSQASIKQSKIIQSIISNIQANSSAENSYDNAFDQAATCGEGYFRIYNDYASSSSFDQEIFIKPIDNVFSVYIDPHMSADLCDIKWAFVFDTITRKEYKHKFKDSEIKGDYNSWIDNEYEDWINEDDIRIAEYYYIDYEEIDLVLLSDGLTLNKEDYNKLKNKKDLEVIKERKSQKKIIKWVKTNGYEILEETTIPGEYIPIIPVFGETYIVDGKRVFEGIVRHAKNAQILYNLYNNTEAEVIGLSPKVPYVGAFGQFEGVEHEWAMANVKSLPFLQYKPVSLNNQTLPPPSRSQFDPNISTVVNAKNQANEDLKATTGIFDSQLGKDQSNSSGIAIMTKKRQSETSNFMFSDNLAKSLKLAGKVILSMLPEVYDNERIIRIVDDNNRNKDKTITLNGEEEDSLFLGLGKYDVQVSIGPYGENGRQQAIESMLALMSTYPDSVPLIADIFVRSQDWDKSDEIADRLKLLLPPELQDKGELPPELQAQIAQAQQQYEAQIAQDQQEKAQMQTIIANITAELNETKSKLDNKQAQIDSDQKMKAEDNRVKLIIEQMKQEGNDARLYYQQEMNYLNQQKNPNNKIPQPGDQFVLAGVNDPITLANEQQEELSQEEQQRLINELDNYLSNPEQTNPTNTRTFGS